MTTFTHVVPDEAALPRLAAAVAAALPARAFVALHGDLGAGKTTFVQQVAAALGIDPTEVVSPTFGLIHVHHGTQHGSTCRLVHADMYRLPDAADLHETGWDDAIADPCQAFVEWPERIATALPADRLDVTITIDGPTSRTFAWTPTGPTHEAAVARLRDLLAV
jgi:tRNA threonylcarbamoyl adenosine modification protein YjeE